MMEQFNSGELKALETDKSILVIYLAFLIITNKSMKEQSNGINLKLTTIHFLSVS